MDGRPRQRSEPDLRSSQLFGRPQPPIPNLAVTGVKEVHDYGANEDRRTSAIDAEIGRTSLEPGSVRYTARPYPQSLVRALASILEQVRKWAMSYDGRSDPLGFLEDLDEHATTYADQLINFSGR